MLLFVFVFYPKQLPTRVCESVLFYWFFFGYLQIKGKAIEKPIKERKINPNVR